MVSRTPRPFFTTGKYPLLIVQEAGWAPEPVWTGGKTRPTGMRSSDRPARSQSLYRLSYPAHKCDAEPYTKFNEDGETDAAISFHCRLPYAEAVLSELFRVSPVAPATPPHCATKDTTLKSYYIPKVCIEGSVISETCSLATQIILYHQGDGDGVGHSNDGFYN